VESGRIKSDDLSTLRIVLDAVQQVQNNEYAILMNKCNPKWLTKIDRVLFT